MALKSPFSLASSIYVICVEHTSEHLRRVPSRCAHGPNGISLEPPVEAVLALHGASRQKVRYQDFWAFILALREVSKPSI